MYRTMPLLAALLLLLLSACDQTSTSERIGVASMSYCEALDVCTPRAGCNSEVFDDGYAVYEADPACLPLWEAVLACGETLPCADRADPFSAAGCATEAAALDSCTP